jgi:hypothetical protein
MGKSPSKRGPSLGQGGPGSLGGREAVIRAAGFRDGASLERSRARRAGASPATLPPLTGTEEASSAANGTFVGKGIVSDSPNARAHLRPDWRTGAEAALNDAVQAYELYKQLHAFFGPLMAAQQRERDNRDPTFQQAVGEFQEDRDTAAATVDVLREQMEATTPSVTSMVQIGHVFRTLTHGARVFGEKVTLWSIEGVVKAEAAQFAPGLIQELVGMLHKAAETLAQLLQ